MSHDAERAGVHPSAVASTSPAQHGSPAPSQKLRPAVQTSPPIDPAARRAKRAYNGLSASSVGLELGLAVVLGLMFGIWLDGKLGTEPWMMLLFLVLGLVAGFRNLVRAIARADKAEL
jgi:ATP synthase protein I